MQYLVEKDIFVENTSKFMLFPYAKDLFYHPKGILSMNIEIFDKDGNNFEFSFGIDTHGELKEFLDHLYDKGENDEKE